MIADPFAGRTEITSEEYRSFLDGRSPEFPPIGGDPAPPDWTTSEKKFQQRVVDFARNHDWVAYHTFNSASSAPGFPDIVFARDGIVRRVAELKVGDNKPTKDQRWWLDAFAAAGIPANVWTPEMWQTIEEVLR